MSRHDEPSGIWALPHASDRTSLLTLSPAAGKRPNPRVRRNPVGRFAVVVAFFNPLFQPLALHRVVPVLAAAEATHTNTRTHTHTRPHRDDHATQLLMDLHWLRVPQRIQYDIVKLHLRHKRTDGRTDERRDASSVCSFVCLCRCVCQALQRRTSYGGRNHDAS